MIKLKAAGGVVIRNHRDSDQQAKEVLLIRRNGVWDLPKGKLESNESIEECAVREVEEETGVFPLRLLQPLCNTVHTYIEKLEKIEKTTHWYLMKAEGKSANQLGSPQTEEGITEVAWESLENALEMVHYDNLKDVMYEVMKVVHQRRE